nr:MAG TPA: hypothetical protein [Caudoviricetes sp.]
MQTIYACNKQGLLKYFQIWYIIPRFLTFCKYVYNYYL